MAHLDGFTFHSEDIAIGALSAPCSTLLLCNLPKNNRGFRIDNVFRFGLSNFRLECLKNDATDRSKFPLCSHMPNPMHGAAVYFHSIWYLSLLSVI